MQTLAKIAMCASRLIFRLLGPAALPFYKTVKLSTLASTMSLLPSYSAAVLVESTVSPQRLALVYKYNQWRQKHEKSGGAEGVGLPSAHSVSPPPAEIFFTKLFKGVRNRSHGVSN